MNNNFTEDESIEFLLTFSICEINKMKLTN